MTTTPRIQVVFLQRLPRSGANFSLEGIFDDVRERLKDEIVSVKNVAPVVSSGFTNRWKIAWDAYRHQSQVNHVTGDIHFAAIPLKPSRSVLTIPDCGFNERLRGFKRRIIKCFWLDLPVRRVACVTTISESAKSEIVRLSGIQADRVQVIPVAISDRFGWSPKAFDSECPRILHVGTAPNKNLLRLAEALRGLTCRLVIIGKLNDQQREALATNGISFENQVGLSQAEVIEQYVRSDLLAFPSTYEGFGMPILEANAVGRPVLTSSISSMPEVAGKAAVMIDPTSVSSIREGIRSICASPGLRQNLIEEGRLNVQRFRGDRIARQYLAIYQKLAGQS